MRYGTRMMNVTLAYLACWSITDVLLLLSLLLLLLLLMLVLLLVLRE